MKRLLKSSLAVVLLPLCIGAGKALIDQVSSTDSLSHQQFYFMLGFISYLMIQAVFFKPIRTYIFGHELSHALWSMLFGGRVKEFNVSKKGGSVLLTKTNFIINLAPYFFPIYTFIVLLIYFGLGVFVDVKPYVSYMVFLVGFTLSFHIALTFNSLTTRQPDVIKTGFIFSLVLILLINIITVVLILKIVTPEKISIAGFFRQSFNVAFDIYTWIIIHVKSFVLRIFN